MKTQTKCTLSLLGLLIVEIFPIPLTVIYCLYVVRKRPNWVPGTIERLYSEKEETLSDSFSHEAYDSMVTRKRCTISFSIMFLLDILIPFTILFALFIVRKRPFWFKRVVDQLYADLLSTNATRGVSTGSIEKKYNDLHKSNIAFALSINSRTKS